MPDHSLQRHRHLHVGVQIRYAEQPQWVLEALCSLSALQELTLVYEGDIRDIQQIDQWVQPKPGLSSLGRLSMGWWNEGFTLLLAATGSRLTELTLAFYDTLPSGPIANLHSLRKLTLDSSFASTAPRFGMLTALTFLQCRNYQDAPSTGVFQQLTSFPALSHFVLDCKTYPDELPRVFQQLQRPLAQLRQMRVLELSYVEDAAAFAMGQLAAWLKTHLPNCILQLTSRQF